MPVPNPGLSGQSPWVDPGASQATLNVLANANAIASQPYAQGYGFVAFHGNGHVWLAQIDALGGLVHAYRSIEEAVGNSNDAGGFPIGGGGNTEAFLETAGSKIIGQPIVTGANSVVIAVWNVVTKNDQKSQGQSPTGPNRRIILSATILNSDVSGAGPKAGQPVTNTGTGQTTTTPAGTGGSAISNANGGNPLNSVFSVLQSGNLWLRIGEGILGIVLIAIGIAKLTNAVPIATKVAKTAGAVAVL